VDAFSKCSMYNLTLPEDAKTLLEGTPTGYKGTGNHFPARHQINTNNSILWDITPCSLLKVKSCFGGTCHLDIRVNGRSRRSSLCHLLHAVSFAWLIPDIPIAVTDISFLQSCPEAHALSNQIRIWGSFSMDKSARDLNTNTHLHIITMLRIYGAILPLHHMSSWHVA
jgi:hypothetical protein